MGGSEIKKGEELIANGIIGYMDSSTIGQEVKEHLLLWVYYFIRLVEIIVVYLIPPAIISFLVSSLFTLFFPVSIFYIWVVFQIAWIKFIKGEKDESFKLKGII